jgi:hypothetical protein
MEIIASPRYIVKAAKDLGLYMFNADLSIISIA